MENTLTGLQKITDRILADAEQDAAEMMREARDTAVKTHEEMLAAAKASAEDILAKAKMNADAVLENAAAGADSRTRGERLHLKNEYADKACALAKERFIELDPAGKQRAYAKLLTDAVNVCAANGASAELITNEADKGIAAAVIAAAEPSFNKHVTISPSDTSIPDAAGFVLRFGDIEVNCTADALFRDLDSDLKKAVLSLLFAG